MAMTPATRAREPPPAGSGARTGPGPGPGPRPDQIRRYLNQRPPALARNTAHDLTLLPLAYSNTLAHSYTFTEQVIRIKYVTINSIYT